jgi:hypothetical protein
MIGMNTVSIVMSCMLAVLVVALGLPKIFQQSTMVARFQRLGYSVRICQAIGALEVAAAVGLVAGIWWRPLGIAAAVGLVALLIGATVSHLRAGDGLKEVVPAIWVGMVAAATAGVAIAAM